MPNRSEDDLVLYLYGEHPDAGSLERELAHDSELAARLERLRGDLEPLATLADAEPRPGLEGRIWHRVAPELRRAAARPEVAAWRWLGLAAAAGLLVAVGFVAGRRVDAPGGSAVPQVAAAPETFDTTARQRLLRASLGSHLEASERLMVELTNGSGPVDERRLAGELLASNRLYRRAAERSGQTRLARLLAELEPMLVELANSDSATDSAPFDAAREQIDARDLLFKVRVTRMDV